MVNTEMGTFLRDLFARCQPGCPVTFLTLSAIHPDGDHPTPSRHVPLGDQVALDQALEQLVEANRHGWGAYIGIATRQRDLGRWSRGGKSDLAALPALFADLDEPEDALIRLGWFDLPASCILHSGRGYHAYWFLERPTTDFVTAEQALHGLAGCLRGDEALSVAQSMRLPGTINTKPGRADTPCTLVGYHPERLYNLDEFRPFIPRPLIYPYRHRMNPIWTPDDQRQLLIDAVTGAVIHLLDGHYRPNGFIAARCPLPHLKDRPGMHFSYQPDSGWGYCFGKHGKFSLAELGRLLGIPFEAPQGDEVSASAA
jgi:hypothetical protein